MAQAFRVTENETHFNVSRVDAEPVQDGQEYTVKQEDGSYLIRKQEDVSELPTSIALPAYNATVKTALASFRSKRDRTEGVWEALQALSGPNGNGGTGHMVAKTVASPKAKKATAPRKREKASNGATKAERTPKVRSFKEIEPCKKKEDCKPAREGSKVAMLIDLLSQEGGTTIKEIEAKLSKTGRPVNARSWLGHSLRTVHGYGVRAKQVDGQERLFLAFPEGMRKAHPHKSREEDSKKGE